MARSNYILAVVVVLVSFSVLYFIYPQSVLTTNTNLLSWSDSNDKSFNLELVRTTNDVVKVQSLHLNFTSRPNSVIVWTQWLYNDALNVAKQGGSGIYDVNGCIGHSGLSTVDCCALYSPNVRNYLDRPRIDGGAGSSCFYYKSVDASISSLTINGVNVPLSGGYYLQTIYPVGVSPPSPNSWVSPDLSGYVNDFCRDNFVNDVCRVSVSVHNDVVGSSAFVYLDYVLNTSARNFSLSPEADIQLFIPLSNVSLVNGSVSPEVVSNYVAPPSWIDLYGVYLLVALLIILLTIYFSVGRVKK